MQTPSDYVNRIKRWRASLVFSFIYSLFFMIPIFICYSMCDFSLQKDLAILKSSVYGIILSWLIQVLILIIYCILLLILKDEMQIISFYGTFKFLFFSQTFAIFLIMFSCIFIFNYSYFPDTDLTKEQLEAYNNTISTVSTIGYVAFVPNSVLLIILMVIICCTD